VPAPIDLPDVNVWLAYSMEDHVHHKRAKAYWLDESADRVAFCRTTALGFLRLSTNTHVMGGAPLSAEEAWRAYTSMRRVSEIVLDAVENVDGRISGRVSNLRGNATCLVRL
jgi:predicted nucleic acid-binding protein